MTLALALAGAVRRIALIESAPVPSPGDRRDDRGLALSPSTARVFEALGLWDRIGPVATPIRRIHVSEEGRFGCVRLDAADLGGAALGHVVPAAQLASILAAAVAGRGNVEVLRPARVGGVTLDESRVAFAVEAGGESLQLECRLLVAADGARSALRKALGVRAVSHDYGQTAIVSAVKPARDHGGGAFERFSPQGSTAILPLHGGRCTAVLCVPTAAADTHLGMPERAFLDELDRRGGRRLGGFTAGGGRSAWPLVRVVAGVQARGRVLFLGNAAHTLHPNAAQGLNLAVRDIAALAELVQAAADPGGADLIREYLAMRKADQDFVISFTHELAGLFYTEHCGRALARRAGMLLIERLPPLKRALVRRAAGLRGRQPRWVRGAVLP
jgi:2-octaprenyl-6-methoxyphenol hydroxylase